MNSSSSPVQEAPLEKLSRRDFQKLQAREENGQRSNDQVVLGEIRKRVKFEEANVSFDHKIVAERAYEITLILYGAVYCTVIPDCLLDRVTLCRRLFDRFPGVRFPETTFFYVLVALRMIYYDSSILCLPAEAYRLLHAMAQLVHEQRESLILGYRDSRAINVLNASCFLSSKRFSESLVKEVLDAGASGPAKARTLRRFWPKVVELGLIMGQTFVDGSKLSVGFKTFREVEAFFSNHAELCVLGFLRDLAVAHHKGIPPIQTEIGLESIDRRWLRGKPTPPPTPAVRSYLGKLPPVDLTQLDSCRHYFSSSQFESFISASATPIQKATALKILWTKVPDVGIIVADIASPRCTSGSLIDRAFITFSQGTIPLLGAFFERHGHWTAYNFANLLGFCLRQKQTIFDGGGLSSSDPAEDRNYWIASRIRTVEQAVKHFNKIHSAWIDEERIFLLR